MSKVTIKPEFIEVVRKDEDLKMKIAKASGVKMSTVDRWLKDGDETLTTFRNLTILRTHFGVLEVQELLESVFLQTALAAAS